MASAKDIKKKIRSISNTRKITKTMEMVATVKSKRGTDRIRATTPYARDLAELVGCLAMEGAASHPLLRGAKLPGAAGDRKGAEAGTGKAKGKAEAEAAKTLLVVVTANRGLCGGYNMNVLSLAEAFLEEERAAGRPVETWVIGKKGVARFRFRRQSVARSFVGIGDNPAFSETEELSREFVARFAAGELDRVVVIATRYFSSSVHRPLAIELFPLDLQHPPLLAKEDAPAAAAEPGHPQGGGRAAARGTALREAEPIFEPSAASVLDALLPVAVEEAFYRILVEARASEHLARRVAMKMATDNAETMIRTYTTQYNRQRQAGITTQIVEIVSGADALE
jgi:F-type H+-transporting ATPase subunit gamma